MIRLPLHKFRLYVAGDAPNSRQAVSNLAALCRSHLVGQHDIEIVDVLREPHIALAASVFMTPTLTRISPVPPVRIVGTLSQTEIVMLALGLESAAK